MKKYIKLLRVHHYIKNLLVFLPLVCSGGIKSSGNVGNCFLAFVIFCFVASSIYIFNDIFDKEQDKLHPRKSKRPIASGQVSVKQGIVLIVILLIISAGICLYVWNVNLAILVLAYLVMNILYTIYLKNIPIIDVSCVSAGFILRLISGSVVTGVQISNWLYFLVIVFSLYLSLGKRKNELKNSDADIREVLSHYSLGFFDKSMTICLSMTNIFYALWTMDDSTVALYGTNRMIWTVPVVLLITLKYSLDIENGVEGDPVEVILHDKMLLAIGMIYILAMVYILYK